MSYSAGAAAFHFAFELSPIVMTGGLFAAPGFPGGACPLIAITQPAAFVNGLLAGGDNVDLDDFFANFQPAPGSTLVDNDIGHYPFANMSVAANAIIQKPTTLSMLMRCPARGPDGYTIKLATMTALIQVVKYHISAGGSWTVLTPAQIYTNGLLTAIRDVSGGESKQAQIIYQWDFEFPLLTMEQAQATQNSLMSKLTSQTQLTGAPSWTGLDQTVGDPSSLAASGVMPIAASTPAAGIQATNLPPVAGAYTEPGAYNIVGPFSTPGT